MLFKNIQGLKWKAPVLGAGLLPFPALRPLTYTTAYGLDCLRVRMLQDSTLDVADAAVGGAAATATTAPRACLPAGGGLGNSPTGQGFEVTPDQMVAFRDGLARQGLKTRKCPGRHNDSFYYALLSQVREWVLTGRLKA
jgi:hypothetical protein